MISGDKSISVGAEANLLSVGVGVAISQFVLQSEAGVGENIIQVGAPILIGSAVAQLLITPKLKRDGKQEKYYYWLQLGAIGGVAGAAALMAAGALPVQFDAATLGFIGLVGSSVAIGGIIADAVDFTG